MSQSSLFLPEMGFVREPVVLAYVSVGRTKWRELVNDGDAPAPIRLSERVSVYDAAVIRQWIADRAAGVPLTSAVGSKNKPAPSVLST